MGGTGPPPKPAERRARRNQERHSKIGVGAPGLMLRWESVPQPRLPRLPKGDWPEATKRWWTNWGKAPQAEHLGRTDWDFLLDTALIHARFVQGELALAAELRQRVAKFGATPEDRLRLRFQFAETDTAEQKANRGHRDREDRYGEIKPLPGVEREAS